MLRTAVIGLGWWGKQIIECVDRSDVIDVVACVDIDPDAVRAFTEARGLPLLDNYEAALEDDSIEAVILVTPHALHEAQVVAAAAAGKQIFCEKPLALDGAAAKRMIAACDEQNIVLGIGHERRYEPALEEIKRRADAGELGNLLHIEINVSYRLIAGNFKPGWRNDPKQAPAGALTALGVHMTDWMQTIAGPVKDLYAGTADRSDDYPGSDVLAVHFNFASGVTGYMCNIATTPFYQRITVFGDKAWAEDRETTHVSDPEPACLTWRGLAPELYTRTYKNPDVVLKNLNEWATAATGDGHYRFTAEENLHNVQILEAIVKSAETGTVQPVG